MGEHRSRTTLKSSRPHSAQVRKMASPTPGASNLTALFQNASTAGDAKFVHCPPEAYSRLRSLNEAEVITLFTPIVPHPPGTALARNMDPFEPLGRTLPRQVRHVPYRLDRGMTDTHIDFLPASGAIIIVICSTDNVIGQSPHAFEYQLRFARDVRKKVAEIKSLAGVPLVALLITNGAAKPTHEYNVRDFPALVTLTEYSTAALANATRIMFGR